MKINRLVAGAAVGAALLTGVAIAQTISIPLVPLASMSGLDLVPIVPGGQPSAQTGYVTSQRLSAFMMSTAFGSPPVLTSCGTAPAVAGNDFIGTVTMGTGSPTGCVITFASARTTAPVCVVSWAATPLASQSYTVSTTALTLVQTATSSNKVNYFCGLQAPL